MRPLAWSRFMFMLVFTCIFVLSLVAVPQLLHFDPSVTDLGHAYVAPGQDGYVLGSDSVGRDVALRTLYGGSESVLMAFAIVGISLAIGLGVGLVAGLSGGVIDVIVDKVITMFQAFPSFVLAIAVSAIMGQGTINMVIAIVFSKWTEFARMARSLAMTLKSSDSIKAGRVCGAGIGALACKYLLPNMLAPLMVMAALSMGDAVLTMAGLSFLGLGPGRPTNEWGAIMSAERSSFQFAPWCVLVPGMALFVTVTIFNLLSDALRDVLDVRTSSAGEGYEPVGWSMPRRERRREGRAT